MSTRIDSDAVTEHTIPVSLAEPGVALVIIDLQYASAYRTTGVGKWLDNHGRAAEGEYRFSRGAREFDFLDELAPQPGDLVVTKLSASAFSSSDIDALLRDLAMSTLVFAGVSASQCVDLTARDAADRGYRCVIVEDAVAEDVSAFHHATLEQFQRLFGAVMATGQVIAAAERRAPGGKP